MKTPEDIQREKLRSLICEILGDDNLSIRLQTIEIKEDLSVDSTQIMCQYTLSRAQKLLVMKGSGRGLVDALYSAFVKEMGKEFSSLKSLKVVDFRLNAEGLSKYTVSPGTKAFVEAHLMMKGDSNSSLLFHSRSRSTNTAAIKVVCMAIEYYINSELAFRKLKELFLEAKGRNRVDVAESYNKKMIELVNVNSYPTKGEKK